MVDLLIFLCTLAIKVIFIWELMLRRILCYCYCCSSEVFLFILVVADLITELYSIRFSAEERLSDQSELRNHPVI